MPLARSAAAALLLFSSTVLFPTVAGASDQSLKPLPYDLAVDGTVTATAAVATLTLEFLLKNDLAPSECKWCNPGSIDGSVSRSLAWSNPQAADTTSTVLALALPAGLIGYGLFQAYSLGDPTAGWVDALLIVEAGSLAMLVNEAVKYLTGRARPYVWQGQPGLYGDPQEQNLSFFSGHTTLAFAAAASAGTLFMMQNVPGAPVVLGVGLGTAAFIGYLRMAADQHYLSDVLVGAAVGGLIGWGVPYLFHRPAKKAIEAGTILPAPGGIAVAW